jgi:hypothetical protein
MICVTTKINSKANLLIMYHIFYSKIIKTVTFKHFESKTPRDKRRSLSEKIQSRLQKIVWRNAN